MFTEDPTYNFCFFNSSNQKYEHFHNEEQKKIIVETGKKW
jgi:hypothetical protein